MSWLSQMIEYAKDDVRSFVDSDLETKLRKLGSACRSAGSYVVENAERNRQYQERVDRYESRKAEYEYAKSMRDLEDAIDNLDS